MDRLPNDKPVRLMVSELCSPADVLGRTGKFRQFVVGDNYKQVVTDRKSGHLFPQVVEVQVAQLTSGTGV
jgi:hypothetical protein